MPPTRKFIPTREWEDERQLRGLEGERLALAYLTSCGWSIEAHRFRMGRHDIDLIARRAGMVAFVEVKSRRGAACGTPLESIPRRKQTIIGKVAALWALRFGRSGDTYRFDAIAVHMHHGGRVEIEHVEDAWRL
jgi:putative endonuclease